WSPRRSAVADSGRRGARDRSSGSTYDGARTNDATEPRDWCVEVSHLVVDGLADLGPWVARAPDGSASAALAVGPGPVTRTGSATMRIEAGPSALGHRVERELAAVDLSAFDDLELWVRCDRVADGSDARPFFLE